jgi:hypothetical protein
MPCSQGFPLHKNHIMGITENVLPAIHILANMAGITENILPGVLAGMPAVHFEKMKCLLLPTRQVFTM